MKQILSILLFIIIASCVSAQSDTTYFLGPNGSLTNESSLRIKKDVDYKWNNKIKVTTFHFTDEGWNKRIEETWKKANDNTYKIRIDSDRSSSSIQRTYKETNNNRWFFTDSIKNQIVRKGYTLNKTPLKLDSMVVEYYPNGQVKSKSIYNKNQLVSNKNWLENGVEYIDNIFYSTDKFPQFSKGTQNLNEQILASLKKNGVNFSEIHGRVTIGFVVFENGKTGGYRVLEGITPTINKIVINAFHNLEGEWEPAVHNEKKVRFFQTFPITFSNLEYQVDFFDFYSGLVKFERK
jgi:predicted adenine nucleotide alpha hydrolase (AANH) superfamily ATPase